MTKFFSQDKFLLGEVAPLYYHDKQVLSSGNGLKQALNTQILSGGQISKRCGFAFIDKLSDNKTPLRIIPFAYNRFYNYALVFYYKEDQGVFIDVYDNFGLLVQDSINTGYDVSEVLEIKYFQANDILFLHTFKSINMVLRIKGLFYLTTGDFRDYYELKKQKIGLAVIVSNDVYKVI
jgi:hypothetical protein